MPMKTHDENTLMELDRVSSSLLTPVASSAEFSAARQGSASAGWLAGTVAPEAHVYQQRPGLRGGQAPTETEKRGWSLEAESPESLSVQS